MVSTDPWTTDFEPSCSKRRKLDRQPGNGFERGIVAADAMPRTQLKNPRGPMRKHTHGERSDCHTLRLHLFVSPLDLYFLSSPSPAKTL